jgi:hypothetical protein
MDGFIEPPVKGRIMLIALQSRLGNTHRPLAYRLVDARLHSETVQGFHSTSADLEDRVTCEGTVQVHLRMDLILQPVWHCWRLKK